MYFILDGIRQNKIPKMALAVARVIEGAKKVLAPSKSLDFHGDPLVMALVMAFP